MRVLVVVGTRPEAIKLAPVILEARRRGCEVLVCATAQHREMLDGVLRLFGIVPDSDLDLMRPDQTLADLTARALQGLDQVVAESKPDWLLVQGDTTTAMVGALVGFYRHVPVGHIEAGLRSFDLEQPFPEELNRIVADVASAAHFVPTETARENLLREGRASESIHVTGNTVIDALHETLRRTDDTELPSAIRGLSPTDRLVLVTIHRRESFGHGIESAAHAIEGLARDHSDVQVVFPVHPNPNVRETVHRILGECPRVHLVEPLGYAAFVQTMSRAHLILTDSGGVQEEAPALGVPVLVLRRKTERPEAMQAGAAALVGTDVAEIRRRADLLISSPDAHAKMARAVSPYGDGAAAARIVAILQGRPWETFSPVRGVA